MNKVPVSFLTLLFVLTTGLAACSQNSTSTVESEFGRPRNDSGIAVTANDPQRQILEAQAAHSRKVQVIFTARVRKLLPDDTKGLPHQRFLLDLANGTTVLVAHNTRMAPRVPLKAGDVVSIKGEFIWNEKGGVVHWTHHTDTPSHEGGYIDWSGQRYQ